MKSKSIFKKNALLYIAPAILLTTIWVFYPLINAIIISFVDRNGGGFTLENYSYVLSSARFLKAFQNTFIYALIATPLTLIISLFISFLLSQKFKIRNLFQTIYFLPYVTSTIAIGAVWKYMYHTNYGLINVILENLNMEPIGWLTDAKFSMISVIIFGVWKALAFNILLLFTAISGIDEGIEKAALIDGASPLKIFFKIKLPQIYPVISYLIIIGVIHSLKVFEEVKSLFGLSPGINNSAITLVYYIQNYFITDRSAAAVAAVVLLLFALILTMLNRLITKYVFKRGD